MAEAKAICGSCGAGVTFGVERCPACGEHLTWSAPAAGASTGAGRACLNCGQLNPPGAVTCSSCGSKLGVGKPQRQQKRQQSTVHEVKPRRTIEPWQIISVVAILALVGVLVYVELSRDHAPVPEQAAAPKQMTMPPMMQNQPVVDVAALEAAVTANPTDARALLNLANGLHDSGEFLRAVEIYKRYLKTQPKDP